MLWRYLLGQFFKIFILCVIAFIAILLTMRLEEIAYVATLGPEMLPIIWFIIQQIPYILPIAFPIAALISSILIMQNLSQSQELTAMRSSGFAFKDIFAPILLTSLALSGLNFYIVSELSTASHLHSSALKNQLRSVNPLLLLHNRHTMQMRGFYFDAYGASRIGEFAEDIVFLSSNHRSERLNMLVAKRLESSKGQFKGNHIAFIMSHSGKDCTKNENPISENCVDDDIFIENIAETYSSIEEFSDMLDKKTWSVNNDHLKLSMLLIRLKEAHKAFSAQRLLGENSRPVRHFYHQCITELIRRISVGLAVLSFTFMGLVFGIRIGRRNTSRGVVFVTILATLYLIAFFAAKSFDNAFVASTALYLVPHIVIFGTSFWMLRRIVHGIE